MSIVCSLRGPDNNLLLYSCEKGNFSVQYSEWPPGKIGSQAEQFCPIQVPLISMILANPAHNAF